MKKYGLIIFLILLLIVIATGSYFAGVYFKSKGTKTVVNKIVPTPTSEAKKSAEITVSPATSPTTAVTQVPTETPTPTPKPIKLQINKNIIQIRK
jgi:flagellar basal body-associated protein FliL